MEIDELRDIVGKNDWDRLQELTGQMQMYDSNILGSDAYFAKHWKELEALMQSEGMPTMWFAFSAG